MRSFNAWMSRTMARLGGSSLEDWASFLESFQIGVTPPQSQESLRARITAFLLTPRVLVVPFICWLLLILALLFVFIPRISWGTPVEDESVNSTGASPSENDSDGLMDRKLFCSPSLLCDGSRSVLEDDLSPSRSGMLIKGCNVDFDCADFSPEITHAT